MIILKEDLQGNKGCIHNERPKETQCKNCGQNLCYECIIPTEIGRTVMQFKFFYNFNYYIISKYF